MYSISQLTADWDGAHNCELVAIQEGDFQSYILLLNLRSNGDTSELPQAAAARENGEKAQLELGAPVRISITLDDGTGEETWSGHTMNTSDKYLCWNTVVSARRPPKSGGRVDELEAYPTAAKFEFGHFPPPQRTMQRNMIMLMLDRIEGPAAKFFKEILLSKDVRAAQEKNPFDAGLPTT